MTKEQLEAIWKSSEIGWLKRQSTNIKKKELRRYLGYPQLGESCQTQQAR